MSVSRSESSRINGSKSTGPVTDEGRVASSRNALKFGIFSKRRFIGDENPEEYDALIEALAREFNPATTTEWMLIDRMVMARVRRARLERAEEPPLSNCSATSTVIFPIKRSGIGT